MDKVTKIAAAALVAGSLAWVSPAFTAQTTAEDFVIGLSSDFQNNDVATVLAKLQELQSLGFEAVVIGGQRIPIEELLALLNDVRNGTSDGAAVAAMLLAYLSQPGEARFVQGGVLLTSADLNVTGAPPGTVFPAGSAG